MTIKEKKIAQNALSTLWTDVMDYKALVDQHGDEFQQDFDKALAKYRAVKSLLEQLGVE